MKNSFLFIGLILCSISFSKNAMAGGGSFIDVSSPFSQSNHRDTVIMKGTCNAGVSSVLFSGDLEQIGAATSCSGGSFSVAINLSGDEGTKRVNYTAYNSSGTVLNSGASDYVFSLFKTMSSSPWRDLTWLPNPNNFDNDVIKYFAFLDAKNPLSNCQVALPAHQKCAESEYTTRLTINPPTSNIGIFTFPYPDFIDISGSCDSNLSTVEISGDSKTAHSVQCSGGNFNARVFVGTGSKGYGKDGLRILQVTQKNASETLCADQAIVRDGFPPLLYLTSPIELNKPPRQTRATGTYGQLNNDTNYTRAMSNSSINIGSATYTLIEGRFEMDDNNCGLTGDPSVIINTISLDSGATLFDNSTIACTHQGCDSFNNPDLKSGCSVIPGLGRLCMAQDCNGIPASKKFCFRPEFAPCETGKKYSFFQKDAAHNSNKFKLTVNRTFEPSICGNGPVPGTNEIIEYFTNESSSALNKLDILLAIDSSGSLNEERAAIAAGIDGFINSLNNNPDLPVIDFKIAAVLGHGNGDGKLGGQLYRRSSFDDYVISSTDPDLNAKLIFKLVGSNINSPSNLPGDSETDGGEVVLWSLNHALTDPVLFQENKDLGFFREGAALAVIFIADEQDICAVYPPGVIPKFDPQRKEPKAKNKYCGGIDSPAGSVKGGGVKVNHLSVLQTLNNYAGDLPLIVAGLIYTGENAIPPVGENEIAYGYLNIIFAHNPPGVNLAVDLVPVSTAATLDDAKRIAAFGFKSIGDLVGDKLLFDTDHELSQNADSIIKVTVAGVELQSSDYVYQDVIKTVQILPEKSGKNGDEIIIHYRVLTSESFCPLEYTDIGDGTPGNPYVMCSAAQLSALSATNSDWDKHFMMTKDIAVPTPNPHPDLVELYPEGFVRPIGKDYPFFTGNFNGNGHTISDLFMSHPPTLNNIGLFAIIDCKRMGGPATNCTDQVGVVRNLRLTNVDITGGGQNVGSLVGQLKNGEIVKVSVQGKCNEFSEQSCADVTGANSTGGLVGTTSSDFNDPFSIMNLISDSRFDGKVITTTADSLGGLIGTNSAGNIFNSYTSGSVNGSFTGSPFVGGLTGLMQAGWVFKTYSSATVEGNVFASGLVSYNFFSLEPIDHDILVGGYSYYAQAFNEQTKSLFGELKTNAQLQDQNTYNFLKADAPWNFNSKWVFPANDTYPKLQWE